MVVPWCTVKVCGMRDYTVQACTKLPGNSGDCTTTTGLIRVKFAERSFMWDTLFHEVAHAAWDACGLKDTLRRKWGKFLTEDQLNDLEEDIQVAQTPALLSTLMQAGWLTLPEPPERT